MPFDTSQHSYVALRNIVAERTNGIVFWVGSGLSSQIGLPSWDALKQHLIRVLLDKIRSIESSEAENLNRSLDFITRETNNWRAFNTLRQVIGEATWRSSIRELLRPAATAAVPITYNQIWQLKPRGVLTLNLDRLATKAFTEMSMGHLQTEFSGVHVANYTYVLKNPHPFICNLHGISDDFSSWILTEPDLKRQQNSIPYQTFIRSCLSVNTIIFVGIRADDDAVGSFIEHLTALGMDIGEHYWITERKDIATDHWAEKQSIRLIRYDAQNGDHTELSEALQDLASYTPADDDELFGPVTPVGLPPAFSPTHTLPDETRLLNYDAEGIRQILNVEARRILESSSADAIDTYNDFCKKYDQPIYRAWYTNTESGENILLGHTLYNEIASGAFGKVYNACDAEGNLVAVKVLHESIRRNSDFIQAFRRGVNSMKILSDNDVQGMVPYRRAFEIPACVVMEWIDGPNLTHAVSSKQLQGWELILRISSDIADIVRRGHVLPERVLHRDIRPSNVMLRDFYSNPSTWDVVVLDFDLSWHRGAVERSVIHGSAMLGYLAPEQMQPISGVSTRHAAVDSFGMGMVLFFMMGGRDPLPDEHKHTDWKRTLKNAAIARPCKEWRSAPSRFARLVEIATQNHQSERWDMTQIQAELQRLHKAVLEPGSTESAELIAEEIAAKCEFTKDYEWDKESLAAVKETSSGLRVEFRGDESERRVVVGLSWGTPGVQTKAHLGKWIEPRMETVRDHLNSFGWRVEDATARYAYITIDASMSVTDALSNLDSVVDSLDHALELLRF